MRFYDLDALRSVAMLLGIVLHSVLLFTPDPKELWPVQDAYANAVEPAENIYVITYMFIHGLRMPVFFLLSGFFTAMLWRRRGLKGLVDHRIQRIALPLALGAVIIVPICMLLWTTFEPETFGTFDLAYWHLAWLGDVFNFGFVGFGFFHLWFLWHLMLMLVIFAALVKSGVQFTSNIWWGLIPLVLVPAFFMNEVNIFGADTSAGVLAETDVLGYYLLFFLFGVFYYQREMQVKRWWTVGAALGLLIFVPGGLIMEDSEPQTLRWAIAAVFECLYAWLMCFGLMGLFNWIASKPRQWVRYMSDSCYWMYLAHVPLVVTLQWMLQDVGISPHLKFAIIISSVTVIVLVTYHWGVRYTPIGTFLNGKRTRTPRTPPPASPSPDASAAPAS